MKSSWLLVIKYFVTSLLSIVQTTHLSPEDKQNYSTICAQCICAVKATQSLFWLEMAAV